MKLVDNISKNIKDELLNNVKKSELQQKHSAIITYGNKIIKTGFNTLTEHAEVNVLNKLKNINFPKKRCKTIEFYVIRSNDNVNFINSKPCYHCIEYIKKFNITKIIYSYNNKFIKENIDDIENDHICKKRK